MVIKHIHKYVYNQVPLSDKFKNMVNIMESVDLQSVS